MSRAKTVGDVLIQQTSQMRQGTASKELILLLELRELASGKLVERRIWGNQGVVMASDADQRQEGKSIIEPALGKAQPSMM